jgi:hypothetical protein
VIVLILKGDGMSLVVVMFLGESLLAVVHDAALFKIIRLPLSQAHESCPTRCLASESKKEWLLLSLLKM